MESLLYTPSGLWVCSPSYAHVVGMTELWGPISGLTDPRLFSFTVRCKPGLFSFFLLTSFLGVGWGGGALVITVANLVSLGSNLTINELFQLILGTGLMEFIEKPHWEA